MNKVTSHGEQTLGGGGLGEMDCSIAIVPFTVAAQFFWPLSPWPEGLVWTSDAVIWWCNWKSGWIAWFHSLIVLPVGLIKSLINLHFTVKPDTNRRKIMTRFDVVYLIELILNNNDEINIKKSCRIVLLKQDKKKTNTWRDNFVISLFYIICITFFYYQIDTLHWLIQCVANSVMRVPVIGHSIVAKRAFDRSTLCFSEAWTTEDNGINHFMLKSSLVS